MNLGDALSAFQTSSGISSAKISLLIRTILLSLTFVWAAWCVYGGIHHLKHGDVDIEKMSTKILRVLLIVTLMLMLVFI